MKQDTGHRVEKFGPEERKANKILRKVKINNARGVLRQEFSQIQKEQLLTKGKRNYQCFTHKSTVVVRFFRTQGRRVCHSKGNNNTPLT